MLLPESDNEKQNCLNTIPVDEELDRIQDELAESMPKTLASRRDERFLAFHLIYAADRLDYSIGLFDLVRTFSEGFEIEIPETSFAVALAHYVITEREALDHLLEPLLKNWKLDRLGCCTRLILRMALWELKQSGAVPSIIINEAVELAKSFAERDAYKFINGILDEFNKTLHPALQAKKENE